MNSHPFAPSLILFLLLLHGYQLMSHQIIKRSKMLEGSAHSFIHPRVYTSPSRSFMDVVVEKVFNCGWSFISWSQTYLSFSIPSVILQWLDYGAAVSHETDYYIWLCTPCNPCSLISLGQCFINHITGWWQWKQKDDSQFYLLFITNVMWWLPVFVCLHGKLITNLTVTPPPPQLLLLLNVRN